MQTEKTKVAQYNSEGKLIHIYNSIAEAVREVNAYSTASIIEACLYKYKCRGYYWRKIEGNKHPPIKVEINKYKRNGKKVQCWKDGKLKFIACCITEAADLTGLSKDGVRWLLRSNGTSPLTGYSYRFDNPEDANCHMPRFTLYKDVKKLQRAASKPVKLICKSTNEEKIFNSIGDAARALNLSRTTITYALNGKIHSAGGYLVQSMQGIIEPKDCILPGCVKVEVYKDDNLLQVCQSIAEAARLTGISKTRIRNLCLKENKHHLSLTGYGFLFHKEES